jgi:hypothetical protein
MIARITTRVTTDRRMALLPCRLRETLWGSQPECQVCHSYYRRWTHVAEEFHHPKTATISSNFCCGLQSPVRDMDGTVTDCALFAGMSVEVVKDLPTGELVERFWRDCEAAHRSSK